MFSFMEIMDKEVKNKELLMIITVLTMISPKLISMIFENSALLMILFVVSK